MWLPPTGRVDVVVDSGRLGNLAVGPDRTLVTCPFAKATIKLQQREMVAMNGPVLYARAPCCDTDRIAILRNNIVIQQ